MNKTLGLCLLLWVSGIISVSCMEEEDINDSRPKEHYCPITSDIMTDPVSASDGHTYERKAIQRWFDASGNPARSPLTNEPLEHTNLVPNFSLRSLIESWKPGEQRGSYDHNVMLYIASISDTSLREKFLAIYQGQLTTVRFFVPENIGDLGTEALAIILKKNKTLITLAVSSSNVGPSGAKALANALSVNRILLKLDLSSNNIGDLGACAIARMLEHNHILKELILTYTRIRTFGVSALASSLLLNTTLTTLDLQGNNIGDMGACALARVLEENKSLTTLCLYGSNVEPSGIKALASALLTNRTLTDLVLGSNSIGISGVKLLSNALSVNTVLIKLDLSDGKIGGDLGACALAEALEQNKTLKELILGGNDIGDQGAEALANALLINATLTKLDLWGGRSLRRIGDLGACAFARVLEQNKTLRELGLGNNDIGDPGAESLASALLMNTTIINFRLEAPVGGKTKISPSGEEVFVGVLEQNKTLKYLILPSGVFRNAELNFQRYPTKMEQPKA